MRLVLLSGPGGAGTTTLTAATAAAVAPGRRVLAVATDHGLGDILGVPLGEVPVAVDPGYWAAQVDVLARVEEGWGQLRPQLASLLGRGGPVLPSPAELLPPPGAAELAVLTALHGWSGSGDWDVVVLDAGPPAQALRLVGSVAALRWQLGRWLPAHHRAAMSGLVSLTERGAALGDLVTRVEDVLAGAEALLTSPQVSIRVVTTAGSVPQAAARRLAAACSVLGLPVDGVVLRARGHAAPGEIVPGRPTWTVSDGPVEPLGPAALRAVGVACYGGEDPVPDPPARAPAVVEPAGDRYVLRLPLAHVARADLALTRCGDDLVLTVAGHRRRHPLAGVLTRCAVVDAELGDGELRVWFRPDPALWPDTVPRPAAVAS